MPGIIHGIAIDPTEKTVEAVDFAATHEGLRAALKFSDRQFMDSVTLARNVRGTSLSLVMWVDDEGLYREDQNFFTFTHVPGENYFAGRAVITMVDETDGETRSVIDRDRLTAMLCNVTVWPDVEYAGQTTTEGEALHPMLGRMTKITTTAIFRPKLKVDTKTEGEA